MRPSIINQCRWDCPYCLALARSAFTVFLPASSLTDFMPRHRPQLVSSLRQVQRLPPGLRHPLPWLTRHGLSLFNTSLDLPSGSPTPLPLARTLRLSPLFATASIFKHFFTMAFISSTRLRPTSRSLRARPSFPKDLHHVVDC